MARKHNRDKSDAYLRWKIKSSYTRVEPPPGGKKRLLKAAFQETIKSSSRFSYLNTMVENEDYQESQVYMAWALASRFSINLLSTIKLR
jgi:hypothetical protein